MIFVDVTKRLVGTWTVAPVLGAGDSGRSHGDTGDDPRAVDHHDGGVAAAPSGTEIGAISVTVGGQGGTGHTIADGAKNGAGTDLEAGISATGDAASAAGGGGDVVDAGGDDQGNLFVPAVGAGEIGAAFLDAWGNDVAVGIGFDFGDEHGHVNHG